MKLYLGSYSGFVKVDLSGRTIYKNKLHIKLRQLRLFNMSTTILLLILFAVIVDKLLFAPPGVGVDLWKPCVVMGCGVFLLLMDLGFVSKLKRAAIQSEFVSTDGAGFICKVKNAAGSVLGFEAVSLIGRSVERLPHGSRVTNGIVLYALAPSGDKIPVLATDTEIYEVQDTEGSAIEVNPAYSSGSPHFASMLSFAT